MITGRHSALEIVGARAYRFAVFGYVVEADETHSPEYSEGPVEAFALPLAREVATVWAWKHFEDLGPDGVTDIVARLVRPAGPLIDTTVRTQTVDEWLGTLPAGGAFSVLLPRDEGYDEAKTALESERAEWDDEPQ